MSDTPRNHPDPEVIVFNLKKRYTGVSATVNALVPLQFSQWRLAYCGTPLSNGVVGLTLREAIRLSKQAPKDRPFRIWHVRRDHEMMAGLWARDVLRLPIRLVFTSAAQRRHGWFPRWLIDRMDAVISVTARARDFVPNSCAIVPHGVDTSKFCPPTNKELSWLESGLPGRVGVGIFGRIREEKGTDLFVEAMVEILDDFPAVTAVIAGLAQDKDAKFYSELVEKVRQAGLQDRLIFLGEVSASEVADWYRRCLVCVACPRYEAFGLTPFEAAACGCALICSRTGAFDMLVEPGVNGEMVPLDDAPALAAALRRVLQDLPATLEMGQLGRERVAAQFALENEAAGIAQVYRQLFDQADEPAASD